MSDLASVRDSKESIERHDDLTSRAAIGLILRLCHDGILCSCRWRSALRSFGLSSGWLLDEWHALIAPAGARNKRRSRRRLNHLIDLREGDLRQSSPPTSLMMTLPP
jgi:hypothetical protein